MSTVQKERCGLSGGEREVAVAQQPGRLGGAEVGVEDEAGRGANEWQVPRLVELGAQRGRAAVLPDDGPVQRPSRRAVERHEGLTLVGDADGGDGAARRGQATADLGQGGPYGLPDLGGIVFHPARAGEVLRQLPVGDVGDPGLLVDGQGADAGRTRIDGDHDPPHGVPTLTLSPISGAVEGPSWGSGAQTIANGP